MVFGHVFRKYRREAFYLHVSSLTMSASRKQWLIRPMEMEDALAAAKIGKAAFADSESKKSFTSAEYD